MPKDKPLKTSDKDAEKAGTKPEDQRIAEDVRQKILGLEKELDRIREEDDWDEGEEFCRKALEIDPNNEKFYESLIYFLEQLRKHGEADQVYKEACKRGLHLVTEGYLSEEEEKKVNKKDEEYRKSPEYKVFTLLVEAESHLRKKDYENAFRACRKALEIDPKNKDANLLIATLEKKLR